LNFKVVITQIISLFLLIAVGYFLRRSKHLDKKETGAISKLLLDLIIPAMLISSLQIDITAQMLDNFTDLFLYWIAFYLILILLASIISKSFPISRDKKIVLKFFLIFGNVGYMGLPVIDVIFPKNGIFFGSIGVVVFNIFLWTYGANLFLRGNKAKKISLRDIFNNGVIAIIIGLFLMLTGLKLPNLIMNAVNMLAEATFPLSMLVIGSGLAQIKIWGIFKDLNIIAYSTLKLLIIPAAALIILNYFNISDPIRTILILQIAMPAAANGVIFAERYEGNYIFAAECLFLSTLMAGFSIPLISYLTTYLK
jgi:predicted permease